MELTRANPEMAELEAIFSAIQTACKTIGQLIRRSAIDGTTGLHGHVNVQGMPCICPGRVLMCDAHTAVRESAGNHVYLSEGHYQNEHQPPVADELIDAALRRLASLCRSNLHPRRDPCLVFAAKCQLHLGRSGFQLKGGGGSIEPPKTGGGGGREKGSIDRTINQLL